MFTNPNTSKPVVERLRARAEEIATLCREPLPDGDAGLLEAKYRLDASIEEIAKLDLDQGVGDWIERELLAPIVEPAQDGLLVILERRRPQTLAGCVVKLRHAIAWDDGWDGSVEQVVTCLERLLEGGQIFQAQL